MEDGMSYIQDKGSYFSRCGLCGRNQSTGNLSCIVWAVWTKQREGWEKAQAAEVCLPLWGQRRGWVRPWDHLPTASQITLHERLWKSELQRQQSRACTPTFAPQTAESLAGSFAFRPVPILSVVFPCEQKFPTFPRLEQAEFHCLIQNKEFKSPSKTWRYKSLHHFSEEQDYCCVQTFGANRRQDIAV